MGEHKGKMPRSRSDLPPRGRGRSAWSSREGQRPSVKRSANHAYVVSPRSVVVQLIILPCLYHQPVARFTKTVGHTQARLSLGCCVWRCVVAACPIVHEMATQVNEVAFSDDLLYS